MGVEKIVTELKCGNNCEYTLSGGAQISSMDYKVIQNQDSDIFVRCMKLERNGRTSFFYLTEGYTPVSAYSDDRDSDRLVTIMSNLISNIVEIRSNGFLSFRNILLSWDKVYVVPKTLKVRFIYIPVALENDQENISAQTFERELRMSIAKLMGQTSSSWYDRKTQFVSDLTNAHVSLEDICRRYCSYDGDVTPESEELLRLVAINATSDFELVISKDKTVIGRKKELTDASIPFNPRISRKHCEILHIDHNYYIVDNGSANGTFVNGQRLVAGERVTIRRGDIVSFANSRFKVI